MPSSVIAAVESIDETALETVRRGVELAESLGTKLTVIHCQVNAAAGIFSEDDILGRVATQLPAEDISLVHSPSDDVIECILTATREHAPSWLCVSKDALHPAGHLPSSSPTKHLLNIATSPMWLVAPPGNRQAIVMAAIDPTHEHDKPARLDQLILQYAAWIARLHDAKLHVLHSVFAFDVPQSIQDELHAKRRQTVIEFVRPLGLPADQVHVPIALESQAIERYVDDFKPETVVMGAIKRSLWRRILVGSTTQEVAPKIDCDVVTLMPDAPPLD